MSGSAAADRVMAAVRELEDVEQLIFLSGTEALVAKSFTMAEFGVWLHDRIRRHHAREELLWSNLETPPYPGEEAPGSTPGRSGHSQQAVSWEAEIFVPHQPGPVIE